MSDDVLSTESSCPRDVSGVAILDDEVVSALAKQFPSEGGYEAVGLGSKVEKRIWMNQIPRNLPRPYCSVRRALTKRLTEKHMDTSCASGLSI
jgi:hypothetical protein